METAEAIPGDSPLPGQLLDDNCWNWCTTPSRALRLPVALIGFQRLVIFLRDSGSEPRSSS